MNARHFPWLLLAMTAAAFLLLGFAPRADRFTWFM